jgi:hypothetical protein
LGESILRVFEFVVDVGQCLFYLRGVTVVVVVVVSSMG